MQQLYAFSQIQLLAFALVLLRISVFVVVWPVFSVFNVPQHVKILFAFAIAAVIFPVVGWQRVQADVGSMQIVFLIVREVFVGLALGFITRGFFYAVSAAGEMISISLGLSSASLINPAISSQGTAVEQLETVLASLLFLGMNGHHYFLQGLVQSYQTIPLANVGVRFFQADFLSDLIKVITVSAIKLSAPVMVSILILNLTMGFVGKAVPQINVLVMALPTTILAGICVLIVGLPLFNEQLAEIFRQMTTEMFLALKGW